MDYSKNDLKKENEYNQLTYFLEIYNYYMNDKLEYVSEGEKPDFICKRSNDMEVGVELTEITRGNPELIQFGKIIDRNNFMSSMQAIEIIQTLAVEKNKKRGQADWKLSNNTILLMVLTDINLSNILGLLKKENLPDLYDLGFIEIWLADYTQLDAYDDVELFCIFPEEMMGYYQRPNPYQKPYG